MESLLLLGLATICVLMPALDLFHNGIYSWHLRQPRVIQGGIEALGFALAMLACLFLPRSRRLRTWLPIALTFVYLRRHGQDLNLIVNLAYLEAMAAIGHAIIGRAVSDRQDSESLLLSVLVGIPVLVIGFSALSAFSLTTPTATAIVLIALTAIAVCIRPVTPWTLRLVRFLASTEDDRPAPDRSRGILALVVVIGVVIVAKSDPSMSHDSHWYGLRPLQVLVPDGNFFAGIGLPQFVHYYPKLFELLTVPLAVFGEDAIIAGFNVVFLSILLVAIHWMTGLLTRSTILRALSVLTVALTPAIANIANTAKPDLFTTSLVVTGAAFLMAAERNRRLAYLAPASGSAFLALGGKLTAIPFGGLLLLACVLAAVLIRWPMAVEDAASNPRRNRVLAIASLALPLAALMISLLRGVQTSGYPILGPGFLLDSFELLGFGERFPYIGVSLGVGLHFDRPVFDTVAKAFLAPSGLPHMAFVWIGNTILVLGLLAFRLSLSRSQHGPVRSLPFSAVYAALSIAFGLLVLAFGGRLPGADGNYQQIPLAIAFVWLVARLDRFPASWTINLSLASVLAFHALVWFVSSPTWLGGTRAMDLDFLQSPFQSASASREQLRRHGASAIAEYMDQVSREYGPCTALTTGYDFMLFRLPCAADGFALVSGRLKARYDTADDYLGFLRKADIDFLVRPIAFSGFRHFDAIFDHLARDHENTVIDDTLYQAIHVRRINPPDQALREVWSRRSRIVSVIHAEDFAVTPSSPDDGAAVARADTYVRHFAGRRALVLRSDTTYSITVDARNAPRASAGRPCRPIVSARIGFHPHDIVSGQLSGLLTLRLADSTSGAVQTVPLDAGSYQRLATPVTGDGGLTVRAERESDRSPARFVIGDPRVEANCE